jgi:hypothetical protein
MLQELKTSKEIAVDLEHHDARSYVGLVSLMQISTREKDWIVDTLKPWREDLQALNEVFADPNVIKVSRETCTNLRSTANREGLPRRLHGHGLASARSRTLCRWAF